MERLEWIDWYVGGQMEGKGLEGWVGGRWMEQMNQYLIKITNIGTG